MNIDNLFPDDAKNILAELIADPRKTPISRDPSGQEKNYSNVLRKVYQQARQQFPQADSAEQAMELLTIQRFKDDEEKIKNLEKINDTNQKRLAVIGKDNKQLQQTLKSTQQALGSEEQDNEAREKRFQAYITKMTARDQELSNRIDSISQAEVSDVEGKREQELNAKIKELEARRTQAKDVDPEEYKKMSQQIDKLKNLKQEVEKGQEKIKIGSKDLESGKTKLAQEIEQLEKAQNQLKQDVANIDQNIEKKVKAAKEKAELRGTPADYKRSKQRLDALEPKVDQLSDYAGWAHDKLEKLYNLTTGKIDNMKTVQQTPDNTLPNTQQMDLLPNNVNNLQEAEEEEEKSTYPFEWDPPPLTLSTRSPSYLEKSKNIGKEAIDAKRGGIIGRIVGTDGIKYEIEDQLTNRFWVMPNQIKIYTRDPEQKSLFEKKKMKKEQDVVEELLSVFQQRLNKEKQYSEQPRATASHPVLDYSGSPLEQEVDGKLSPVDDFKKQMKHPVSAGSRGTYNLGRSYKGNPGMPYEPLDENQQSPVVDFRKQLANPTTPGSQAMPHWATPGEQYLEDGLGEMTGYSLEDLKHMAKSNKKAAKELARRRKLGENQTLRKDRWITEIYEAI